MSFYESNKYFIISDFYGKMKSKSYFEKQQYYHSVIKLDSRRRIKEFLNNTSKEIENLSSEIDCINLFTINEAELARKVKAYEEIIELFKEYEYESILYAIYFEKLGYQLLNLLSTKLLESVPEGFDDKYLIISFLKEKNHSELHKIFLEGKLEINKKEWREEKDGHNPIIQKLSAYINDKLVVPNTEREIKILLFHYSKLWIYKHLNEGNEKKSILLLFKLTEGLNKALLELKVDLYKLLEELKMEIYSFIEMEKPPPYLEIYNSNRDVNSIGNGYKNQLEKFTNIIKNSNNFLLDLDKLAFNELISKFIVSDDLFQIKIFDKIQKRLLSINLMTSFDFEFFIENKQKIENSDCLGLVPFIFKRMYLFQYIKR